MADVPPPPAPPLHDGYGPPALSDWMAIDWREHRRWVEIEGRWANVVELGAGPPMLFVHGLSGCWQNWLENLPYFARAQRVVAVDLPGFGGSQMPRESITMNGYARFLDRLLDALAIPSATVVSNSMGGLIAAELAITAPARVERLVLVSAAGIASETVPRGRVMAGGRALAVLGGRTVHLQHALARRPGLRRVALEGVVRHADRLPAPSAFELMHGAGKPGFLPALAATLDHRLRHRLHEIACPTLIVWGRQDRIIPVRDAHEFARLIPHAQSVVYDDTGHLAMLERPVAFNALLDDFLAEHARTEPPAAAEPLSA